MGASPLNAPATTQAGPEVTDDGVVFRVPDPDRRFDSVRLYQEVRRPRHGPDFTLVHGVWTLDFRRPDADRMEYLLQIADPDGNEATTTDPGNPMRAPGPFGDKSVVEWPEYSPPSWLDSDAPPGELVETAIKSRTLRAELRTLIWSAPGVEPDQTVPLLVAHDGPEYDSYSGLTKVLAHAVTSGDVPPMRAALIAPVDRDHTYSASAAYARALAYEILPAVEKLSPAPHGRTMRVGMGASLGALSMLHLHRNSPASFGALFLQSGSFFRQRFDRQEMWFPRFGRISRFVGRVLTAEDWPHPVRITMTCGSIEENLVNNRAVAAALERQGYDVRMVVNRDGHNWIGWRDTFAPHLTDLLGAMWG